MVRLGADDPANGVPSNTLQAGQAGIRQPTDKLILGTRFSLLREPQQDKPHT